jgi:ferritin-like metal-binding protein YciE
MPSNTLQEQLTKYLTDAHSIEEQALVQMRLAPRLAGTARIAGIFREHLVETEEHERLTRERLDARGASPSKVKDLVMQAGGAGFALFARSQPDTPGKLVAHAYSYEHLELGAYELLARVAERAGEQDVAETARRIRGQENAMAERLAGCFDEAVDASLKGKDDLESQLKSYLRDAHALESQSIQLLEAAPKLGGAGELSHIYEEHLAESRNHQTRVRERLEHHSAGPSRFKDVAMKAGAINWGTFFGGQPDTPGKLACFAFAFEHLEIAGYEELRRVAERAGDTQTAGVAEQILAEERAAAGKLAAAFDQAALAALDAQGAA